MQRVARRTTNGYASRHATLRDRKGAGSQPSKPESPPLPLPYGLRVRNTPSGTWATLVKRLRQVTGMTGAELARRLNVDRATIWRWEAGKQKPESAEIIKAFANTFGLTVPEVMTAAGLWPSGEPAPRTEAPMDPDVLKLMRMLADPDTPESTKVQIRAMLRVLAEMVEDQSKPPRRRREAG
jgi:transcriptional regulator with XRE-family HTH domain